MHLSLNGKGPRLISMIVLISLHRNLCSSDTYSLKSHF